MNVTGKIKLINETQNVSASFKKRELVVTTDEQYPQDILIEFTQDKCDVLSSYKVNDNVTVDINIRGREWVNPQGESKFFNSIQGWRINKSESNPTSTIQVPADNSEPATNFNEEEHDDLPF